MFENAKQPASLAKLSNLYTKDATIVNQVTDVPINFTYTFDNLNRIKTVKTFDPTSGQLIHETIIDYFWAFTQKFQFYKHYPWSGL